MTEMSVSCCDRPDCKEAFLTTMPLGRWATGDMIVAPAAFQLIAGASMMSGGSWPIGGGLAAC